MHIFNKIKEYEIFEYFFQCTLLTKFSKRNSRGAGVPIYLYREITEKRCLKMISKYYKLLNTSLKCLKMHSNLKISFLGQNLAI